MLICCNTVNIPFPVYLHTFYFILFCDVAGVYRTHVIKMFIANQFFAGLLMMIYASVSYFVNWKILFAPPIEYLHCDFIFCGKSSLEL